MPESVGAPDRLNDVRLTDVTKKTARDKAI
jgi:hypothetical protein